MQCAWKTQNPFSAGQGGGPLQFNPVQSRVCWWLRMAIVQIESYSALNSFESIVVSKFSGCVEPGIRVHLFNRISWSFRMKFQFQNEFSNQCGMQLDQFYPEKVHSTAKWILIEPTAAPLVRGHSGWKDDHVTSRCLYNFKCSCSCNYIGRPDRSLITRAAEQIPKWLVEAMNTSGFHANSKYRRPASLIAKYLIESGHKFEPDKAFTLLYKNSTPRSLRFIEALGIWKFASKNNLFSSYNFLGSVGV